MTPEHFLTFAQNQRFPVSDDKTIANTFRDTLPKDQPFTNEIYAEIYAFTLYENSKYGMENWHTYFGPAVMYFEGGAVFEEIRTEKITPEILTYWERRMKETEHPVLLSRYAGLVWEFAKITLGKRPPFSVATTYIENLLEASSTTYYAHGTIIFRKLARALDLAIRLGLSTAKQQAIQAIRELEAEIGTLGKPGYWKNSYELLVRNTSVGISEQMIRQIIGELEARLRAGVVITDLRPADLNAATVAADYLTEYYRKEKQPEKAASVLQTLSGGFDATEAFANTAMIIHNLEMLYERYQQNGLPNDADAALTKIRSLGTALMAEMKIIQVPIDISMALADRLIDMIYSGDEFDAFSNLATGFIQTTEDLKRDETSIYEMIHKGLYDHTGRKVSTVGSVITDENGNAMSSMGRSMTLMSSYIQFILKAGKNKGIIEPGALMRMVTRCEWFEPVMHPIFQRAFQAYDQNDHIVFLHLAIPQIEAACLKMFEQYGGKVWKENKGGGYHVRLFDDLLRDEAFKTLVGDEATLYLRAVFTDQRGWNLRNTIAHGLLSAEAMTAEKADRVLLVLLLIPFLQLKTV